MKIKYQHKKRLEAVPENIIYKPNGIITFTRKTPITLAKLNGNYETIEMAELKHLFDIGILSTGDSNGYIGLPEGHENYKVDYTNIGIDIHGGLTFSDELEVEGKKYWCIGFDTCHSGDNPTNWPIENVLREVENLYEQLK